MHVATLSIFVATGLTLGACEEAPKTIDYWVAHKDELREMERICLTNGSAGRECENVARASYRLSKEALQRRIESRRAGRHD